MLAFNHVWSLPVMQQRCWSHHSICHSWKLYAACKLHDSVFYKTGCYCRWKFYNRRIFAPLERNLTSWPCLSDEASVGAGGLSTFCSCDLDLDPMTFIYKLDPYYLEIYRMCKYELPTSRLLKVIVWQTRLKLYTTPLHGWTIIITLLIIIQGIASFLCLYCLYWFLFWYSMCSCCYCQEFQKKLSGARRVVIVGNGGIATELV